MESNPSCVEFQLKGRQKGKGEKRKRKKKERERKKKREREEEARHLSFLVPMKRDVGHVTD